MMVTKILCSIALLSAMATAITALVAEARPKPFAPEVNRKLDAVIAVMMIICVLSLPMALLAAIWES